MAREARVKRIFLMYYYLWCAARMTPPAGGAWADFYFVLNLWCAAWVNATLCVRKRRVASWWGAILCIENVGLPLNIETSSLCPTIRNEYCEHLSQSLLYSILSSCEWPISLSGKRIALWYLLRPRPLVLDIPFSMSRHAHTVGNAETTQPM